MNWRRTFGAAFMILGGAAVVAMAALAVLVISNHLEWDNAAEALGSVARVALPPALGGAALLALGRLVYGEWLDRSPMLNASAAAMRLAGFVLAIGLGAMLLFLAATGITAADQIAAVVLGLGTTAGVGLILLGFRMKAGSGRRYLD